MNIFKILKSLTYLAILFLIAIVAVTWGIIVGLWNNPMLIVFIAGIYLPVTIIRNIFKIR